MAKLPRVTAKVFASNAAPDDIGQYGSALTGTKVTTGDITEIQALPAYEVGWRGAVISNRNYPTLQEMNGLQKTFSQQIAYTFQEGIPEYDAGTTYYIGSIVKSVEENYPVLYYSIQDNNTGNALTNPEYWEKLNLGGGSGLPVGFIGQTAFPIDESKGLMRYLNGSKLSINDNTQGFLTKLQAAAALNPSLLASSQAQWDSIKNASAEGQCGKFFINTTESYIQLPCIVKAQGCLNFANIGNIVDQSLPNIKQAFTAPGYIAVSGSNPINITVGNSSLQGGTNSSMKENSTWNLNLNRANSIYKDNANVQEEAVQYPYFIVIATGEETSVNISNETELNNPFFYGQSIYSEIAPNNASWLLSNGQNNLKSLYPDYYDWILENVNNGTDGFKGDTGYCYKDTGSTGYYWWISTTTPKVGMTVYQSQTTSVFKVGTITSVNDGNFTFTRSTDNNTYTCARYAERDKQGDTWINDYDFVINTTDETFRLPIKSHQKALPESIPVIGNGMTLGLTNGTGTGGLSGYTNGSTSAAIAYLANYGVNVGSSSTGTSLNKSLGVTSDSTKSGLIADLSEVSNEKLKLYYYVGDTVQNAGLIDAGAMFEGLASKTDKKQAANATAPSSKYVNLTLATSGSLYTAPAAGWVTVAATLVNKTDHLYLRIPSLALGMGKSSGDPTTTVRQYIYVGKDQQFTIDYNNTPSEITFRFIYAQGEQ